MFVPRNPGETPEQTNQKISSSANDLQELIDDDKKYKKLAKFLPQKEAWEATYGPMDEEIEEIFKQAEEQQQEAQAANMKLKKQMEEILSRRGQDND